MSFKLTCLNKATKTYDFQLSSTSEDICLKSNCEGRYENSNCDNEISISSQPDQSCKIQLRGSGCEFVHRRADDQTGMFLMTNKTWIEALQYCRKLNSTLVEITNQTVQEAVTRLLTNKTGLQNSVWVGLERSIFGINPEWIWTSRNKTINPDWTINHPVDPLNNHCGKVVMVEGQVKLVDENCHESLPFICQGKLGL
ncbi:PREDICTED: lithostathine-1-beta-like isoform X3 [Poecilia mexicana]|uniref:lithostathine-1-beta-like isoform X3 n=1 Tax=Poecilia mexicana TaxID=48701 RepID=UPI00072DF330|nr:PREDICTED: lithostathine-1-beta-like isoform X3 [Poecilia mexicana]